MRRSSSSQPNWKKWRSHVELNVWLRRQRGKQKRRPGRKLRGRELQRRRRGRGGQWSTSNNSGVKIVDGGLCFYFLFSFYFIFIFIFSIFRTNSGQGLSVTLSHQSQVDGIIIRLITRLRRMKQKVLEQSDVMQHGQHMLASCYTHGYLGQGAQQLAQTMGNSI